MTPEAKRQVLLGAVELIGREELARRLAVPDETLESWIRGSATVPDGKFLVLSALLDKAAKRR